MVIKIQNVSGSSITIDDLGLLIENNETIDLLSYGYTLDDIFSSSDLDTYINSENIIVNDGVNNLSISDALKHTNVQSEYVDAKDEQFTGGDTQLFGDFSINSSGVLEMNYVGDLGNVTYNINASGRLEVTE